MHRMIAFAAAAALTAAGSAPAFAFEGKAAAGRAKEARYCVHRHKAGAAAMEKFCRTRTEWVRQDGVDPAKLRRR